MKLIFGLEYNAHGSWGRRFENEVPYHYGVQKILVDGKMVSRKRSLRVWSVCRKLSDMVTRRWEASRCGGSFQDAWDRYLEFSFRYET